MIVELVEEAVSAGAREGRACKVAGIAARTLARWRASKEGKDRRRGPTTPSAHRLSEAERKRVLDVVNSPEFRDLSPKQIVPRLADRGEYIASESTIYRILREEGLLTHRERSRPRGASKPKPHVARGPNQVWSWDITYLRSPIRGAYFYLYLVVDIWSRKIVGWEVHEQERSDLAAALIEATLLLEKVDPNQIALHADNGPSMKGSTMLATLLRLGVAASFSRPNVSDDNPYSEALFRTLKYSPAYPRKPFASVEQARAWVARFVRWYNNEHLHSGIRFVTPEDRHQRRDTRILAKRSVVYADARKRTPRRWTGATRNWKPILAVHLNPLRDEKLGPIGKPVSN